MSGNFLLGGNITDFYWRLLTVFLGVAILIGLAVGAVVGGCTLALIHP